ncbi:hypothetical protein [Reichenbachiella sp.]
MKYISLLTTLVIFGTTLNAQKADLEYINSAIEIRFNIRLDTINLCDSYILNGIAFDQEDLGKELMNYEKSEVKLTAIADLSNTTFFHKNCDYVIIISAGDIDQSNEVKQKELDSIRTNLNTHLPQLVIRDFICEQCKLVVVNGTPIGMYDARTLVNNLKPRNIEYIVSYESANPMVFGCYSVNGLTEIFLKKKADNSP